MSKRYDRPLTSAELANLKDEEIDFSEIPELDENFWRNAVVVHPLTKSVTLDVKDFVVDAFAAEGGDVERRMSHVLEYYVRSKQKAAS
jgi:uncharacterized protein (DUF4415 family)